MNRKNTAAACLLAAAWLGLTLSAPATMILYTGEGDTTGATDQLTADGSQNGTFVNDITVTTDSAFGNNAFGFPAGDGQFDVIDLPNSSNLGNSFTLALQAKTSNTLYQRMISGYSGNSTVLTNNLTFDLDIDNNTAGFGLRAIINGVGTSAALPGTRGDEYHHYAVTYDNTGLVTLYYDGAFLTSKNVGAVNISLSYNLRLGEDHGGIVDNDEFTGSMDDILVYNQALSADEIAFIATNGAEAWAVPEPSVLVLVLLGVGLLVWRPRVQGC